jgi:Protein of unknown function (DUF1214)
MKIVIRHVAMLTAFLCAASYILPFKTGAQSTPPPKMATPIPPVDVYFGPTAPPGKESNWIQTEPNKAWFTLLRLYGALEPWFDKTWRPGEIELVK